MEYARIYEEDKKELCEKLLFLLCLDCPIQNHCHPSSPNEGLVIINTKQMKVCMDQIQERLNGTFPNYVRYAYNC